MTVAITGLKTVGVSHNLLDVSGCIGTIGAMGCQKSITQQIVSRDADYVLAVKRNQGRLYEDLRTLQRRVKGWRNVMARRLVTLLPMSVQWNSVTEANQLWSEQESAARMSATSSGEATGAEAGLCPSPYLDAAFT